MAEWLCCLARTTEVLCSNLGAHRHRMTLDKSLTPVCLRSPGRTLRQAGLLFRVTASNSCSKNIGLSKLFLDSTVYRKSGYSFFFSFMDK